MPGPTASSLSHSRKMSPNNSKGGYSKLPSSNASLTKPNPRVSQSISSSGPLRQISASGTHSTRTGFDVCTTRQLPNRSGLLGNQTPFVHGRFSPQDLSGNFPCQTPNTTPTGLDDPKNESESHYSTRPIRRV
jgi:hypothetical protein